jgi:hypothetical protein
MINASSVFATGAIAVETALVEHGERYGIAAQVDGMMLADNPGKTLGPSMDAAAFTRVALDDRKVELAALELSSQIHAQIAVHVEPQRRTRTGELRQQFGKVVDGEILRDSEPHDSVTLGARDHIAGVWNLFGHPACEEAAPVFPIVVALVLVVVAACVTAVALLFDMKRPCSAAHA